MIQGCCGFKAAVVDVAHDRRRAADFSSAVRDLIAPARPPDSLDVSFVIGLFVKLKLMICAPIPGGLLRGRFFYSQVGQMGLDLRPATPRLVHGWGAIRRPDHCFRIVLSIGGRS